MTIEVAINGYRRIGRNVLRAHYEGAKRHDIEIAGGGDTVAALERRDNA